MSNLEVICRLCDLLDRAQQIIRQQAELLSMHGVETDGAALGLGYLLGTLLHKLGRDDE